MRLARLETSGLLAAALLLLFSAAAWPRHHSHATGLDPDAPYATVALHEATATVAFSPRGGGERLVVEAVQDAKTQVLVQAYGFSNTAILKALTEAKSRGVDVEVILDKSNDRGRYSGGTYVAGAGIPVWIDYEPAIAHNKVMIIDGHDLITGSFNFTTAAQEHNAENVLLLKGVPDLAAAYTKDWRWRQGLTRPFKAH